MFYNTDPNKYYCPSRNKWIKYYAIILNIDGSSNWYIYQIIGVIYKSLIIKASLKL